MYEDPINIAGWYTDIRSTPVGTVASLYLPSSTESENSPSKCTVYASEYGIRVSRGTKYLRWASAIECGSIGWRITAAKNLDLINSLDCTSNDVLSVVEQLGMWMRACQADNLQLFIGGDFTCYEQILGAIEAARSVPEKKVFIQTTRIQDVNNLWLSQNCGEIAALPDNVYLFVRPGFEDLCLADFPTITYSDTEGIDELLFFPTSRESVVLRTHKAARACLERKGTWWSNDKLPNYTAEDAPGAE